MSKKFQDDQIVFVKPKKWFVETYLKPQDHKEAMQSDDYFSILINRVYPLSWNPGMTELLGTPVKIAFRAKIPNANLTYYSIATLDTGFIYIFLTSDLTNSLKDL